MARTACAKALGQKCASCIQGTKKARVAGTTRTREGLVGEEFGEGGGVGLWWDFQELESGFNLMGYDRKPSGDSRRM